MRRIVASVLVLSILCSCMTVAFAKEPNPDDALYISPDGVLYGYDSEIGYLVPKADDGFAPGDTIYIPVDGLEKDQLATVKNYHVFADWAVGESQVESMELLYKRAQQETGIAAVTILPALSSQTYPQLNRQEGYVFRLTSRTTGTNLSLDQVREGLKTILWNDGAVLQQVLGEQYQEVTEPGYLVDGKYYSREAQAALAAGLQSTEEGSYYRDDVYFSQLTQDGSGVSLVSGTGYYKSQETPAPYYDSIDASGTGISPSGPDSYYQVAQVEGKQRYFSNASEALAALDAAVLATNGVGYYKEGIYYPNTQMVLEQLAAALPAGSYYLTETKEICEDLSQVGITPADGNGYYAVENMTVYSDLTAAWAALGAEYFAPADGGYHKDGQYFAVDDLITYDTNSDSYFFERNEYFDLETALGEVKAAGYASCPAGSWYLLSSEKYCADLASAQQKLVDLGTVIQTCSPDGYIYEQRYYAGETPELLAAAGISKTQEAGYQVNGTFAATAEEAVVLTGVTAAASDSYCKNTQYFSTAREAVESVGGAYSSSGHYVLDGYYYENAATVAAAAGLVPAASGWVAEGYYFTQADEAAAYAGLSPCPAGSYYGEKKYYASLTTSGSPVSQVEEGWYSVQASEGIGQLYYPDRNALEAAVTPLILQEIEKIAQSIGQDDYRVTPEEIVEYGYFAAIKTKPSSSAKTLDLAGEVGVFKNQSQMRKYEGVQIGVELNHNGGQLVEEQSGSITVDSDLPVISFADHAGEVELLFGDFARFVVDATDQGKVNLDYSVAYLEEIGAHYPDAELAFIGWTARPAFNKNGTLYLYSEEDTYLYEVTDDGIKEIPSAVYDRSEGGWKLTTRTLKQYVLSDRKLERISDSSSESFNDPTQIKPNPATGRSL